MAQFGAPQKVVLLLMIHSIVTFARGGVWLYIHTCLNIMEVCGAARESSNGGHLILVIYQK